jgi:hypothetical protein
MAAGAPPHGAPTVQEQEEAAGVGILLQISMLVLAFVLGHLLRRRRVYYLPEASASLLIGTYVLCPRHLLSGGFPFHFARSTIHLASESMLFLRHVVVDSESWKQCYSSGFALFRFG